MPSTDSQTYATIGRWTANEAVPIQVTPKPSSTPTPLDNDSPSMASQFSSASSAGSRSPQNFDSFPDAQVLRAAAALSQASNYRQHNKSALRRQNHIKSESDRRNAINMHLDTLRELVPDADTSDPKALTLAKAIEHVRSCQAVLQAMNFDVSCLPSPEQLVRQQQVRPLDLPPLSIDNDRSFVPHCHRKGVSVLDLCT